MTMNERLRAIPNFGFLSEAGFVVSWLSMRACKLPALKTLAYGTWRFGLPGLMKTGFLLALPPGSTEEKR
jgi:hypothetical protein